MPKVNHAADSSRQTPALVKAKKAKNSEDPIATLMRQIGELEADLEVIETKVPPFLRQMQEAMEPFAQRMGKAHGELILWLGAEARKPKVSATLYANITALAFFLHERSQEIFEINHDAALKEAGFWDDDDEFADDPELQELEAAMITGLMDNMLQNMGVKPPQHIKDAIIEAYNKGETPSEEAQAWFQNNQGNAGPSAKATKPRKSKAKAKSQLDPEAFKKSLYHGLARDLHPDKATEAEQELRTALMQKLNNAYQSNDMRTMLQLLHLHGSADMKSGIDDATLKQLKAVLEQQKFELKQKQKSYLMELPPLRVDWPKFLRDKDAQALVLKQEVYSATQDEARYHKVVEHLQKPKELARFFKQFDEYDWDELF